jgi:hypothetical protein
MSLLLDLTVISRSELSLARYGITYETNNARADGRRLARIGG